MLKIREAKDTKFDLVSLGECMVRLSPPGHGRIEFSPTLEVWVGGGEYNVAYALARLGLRTGFASRLVDNPVGKIIVNHARSVGMDVSHRRHRQIRRRRPGRPHRAELHRSRHRRPRQRHHVRPRALRRHATSSRA